MANWLTLKHVIKIYLFIYVYVRACVRYERVFVYECVGDSSEYVIFHVNCW